MLSTEPTLSLDVHRSLAADNRSAGREKVTHLGWDGHLGQSAWTVHELKGA